MAETTTSSVSFPLEESQDALTEILRAGAQTLLAQAIESEVAEWIERRAELTDATGRQVVRNGRLPKRRIATGARRYVFQMAITG